MPKGKSAFARMTLPVIVAVDLSHFEFRVLSLIASKAYSRPAVLSHSQIAKTFGCSERQAIRATAKLAERKYVTCEKRHNYPNSYALNPEIFTVKAVGEPCLNCDKPTFKLSLAGWCAFCTKANEAHRAATHPFKATA